MSGRREERVICVVLVKSAVVKVELERNDMVDLLMRCGPLGRIGRQPPTIPANHETLMARVVSIAGYAR